MRKVILVCNMGMSTSILMKRLEEEGKGDYCFTCTGIGQLEETEDADLILLGPQIGFYRNSVEKKYPEIPVDVIAVQDFGMMDASKILKKIQKMLLISEE